MAGFISDIASSFTGSAARKDARRYAEMQRQELTSGYEKAKPLISTGYANARSSIAPFVASGAKANQLYTDTLGINGGQARDAAQEIYMTDDVLAKIRQRDLRAQGRSDNSRGRFDSGVGAQADAAVRLGAYGNWQDRLKGESDRGGQFALEDARLNVGEGTDLAGLEYGYGQQRAGITGQEGTNVGNSRGVLANNMLSLGSTLVSGFTPGKTGATPFGTMARGVNDLLKIT